ncbi:hypothetical protein NEILACOT_03755 [Neisseria lactamica ATCC 23970]|uniref:Uncharacterized protein n=1 Tax=Neisseria lactamica ATCC 23970 TaxID=546265 RepID=D0W8A2_NEILA|nr:hypothetical protein NEILACOT_03755 [Neisseria lactamica ATCC 23970]
MTHEIGRYDGNGKYLSCHFKISKSRRYPKSQSSLRRYFRAGGSPVIQNHSVI